MRVTHHRRWGPHRIAFHLHLARSTVGCVLARFRMPLVRNIDQTTGLPVILSPDLHGVFQERHERRPAALST